MDNIIPSAAVYTVNAEINNLNLDECSFIGSNDEIYPYFEEEMAADPDVKALMIYLRNSNGVIAGWKVIYSLIKIDGFDLEKEADKKETKSEEEKDDDEETAENEDDNLLMIDDEIVFMVKSLDKLPSFKMPEDLPAGRYTMVFQVMSEKDVLQRTENSFFYLGDNNFTFDEIQVHLPGIAESLQVIPRGMTVLLEAKVDFDESLDPYVVWYNGRRKISEGSFSDGAWQLFWKAPDQSGFYSLRAEVFPVRNHAGLSGFTDEISLLVSSKAIDVHLISENIPQLVNWYVFEGNLNDSKLISSSELAQAARALAPAAKNNPVWMSANGTYGLATGFENAFTLPKLTTSAGRNDTWQILFRFIPVNEGRIFSVSFGSGVFMHLSMKDDSLILNLQSPVNSVFQILSLPEQDSFHIAGVNFSITAGLLSANINIMETFIEQSQLIAQQVTLETDIEGDFQITLGFTDKSADEESFTSLWDEFAVYYMPPLDIIEADITPVVSEEDPETEELY